MPTTWILVCNRAGARLFERRGAKSGLKLLREIEHPEGRKKEMELVNDRLGRTFESHASARHGVEPHTGPKTHVAEAFAHDLAGILDAGRNSEAFASLVLVAEPGFLGLLRKAINPQTAHLVGKEIQKDLAGIPQHELEKHLEEAIRL